MLSRLDAANARHVRDSSGRRWLVDAHAAVIGGETVSFLLASCPECVRRVWAYPPNWADLNAAELLALIDAPIRPRDRADRNDLSTGAERQLEA